MLTLNPQSPTPLVLQIVAGFKAEIDSGALRAGSKAPSIRQFAHAHNVSVFTVVDAYDRLVAQGYFASRPHSGFLSSSGRPRWPSCPAMAPTSVSIRCGTCAASLKTARCA